MSWLNIIIMAVGLAMDCCAVAAVQGLNQRNWHRRALLMAIIFGLFHMFMPIIGYYAGQLFVDFMSRYAPWIALGLLGFLGIKMIWESLHEKEEKKQANWHVTNLLLLALATSIDVLSTGLIFVPYSISTVIPAVLTIGTITGLFSLGGYIVGVYVGKLKINMEIVGGLVLIGLGIKICIEGICF